MQVLKGDGSHDGRHACEVSRLRIIQLLAQIEIRYALFNLHAWFTKRCPARAAPATETNTLHCFRFRHRSQAEEGEQEEARAEDKGQSADRIRITAEVQNLIDSAPAG